MNVTPWFDMSVEPVRDGVYELRGKKSGLVYAARFWRGYWRGATFRMSSAARNTDHSVGVMVGNFDGWRGLAEKPE